MRRERIREFLIWFAAAVLVFYAMSARPILLPPDGNIPDFFYALAFYASYFFPGLRGLCTALCMGLIKDLSFSAVIGPGLLSALFLYSTARVFFGTRFPERQWPYFLQGCLLGFPARCLRILVLSFLPLRAKLPLSLSQRFAQEFRAYLRSLPALLLALGLCWLYFHFFRRWLAPAAAEEGPVVAEDPGKLL